MSTAVREVYVISDLHIGGRYAPPDRPGDRGFRLCSAKGVASLARFVAGLVDRQRGGADVELVINGDFVDFLAEERASNERFQPFCPDVAEACTLLSEIIRRDQPLFDALGQLLAAGAHLTLLLGNHDVELSFPAVRRHLAGALGVEPSSRFTFLYDGEAYLVGDALIEHGNRYDGFNVIDHDALRRMRSLLSRRQPVAPEHSFDPPPGSRLVASIMNPIKERYPFVDLLKPETEAVVPILLALEPSYRDAAREILRLHREARRHEPAAPAMPSYGGDISSIGSNGAGAEPDELEASLSAVLGPEGAARFALAGEAASVSGDISTYHAGEVFGLLRLLAGNAAEAFEARLPALLAALRAVERDRSFDVGEETVPAYLDGARELAQRGIRHVVFGHTHLAKQVDLGHGRTYLNTGTWADLVRFPDGILRKPDAVALPLLRAFVADLAARRFDQWILFRPTYARLLLVDDVVREAELIEVS